MRLFPIKFTHYSPKDSEEGVKGYVLAETEREAMKHIDFNFGNQCWHNADPLEVWDEKLEKIVEVSFLEKIMKERGEFWEVPTDLDYGATQWGWDEGVEISEEDAAVLLRLGIATLPEIEKNDEEPACA